MFKVKDANVVKLDLVESSWCEVCDRETTTIFIVSTSLACWDICPSCFEQWEKGDIEL